MNDNPANIDQLKIDRSALPAARRNWLWPIVLLVLAAAVVAVALWFRAGNAAVLVETTAVQKPPSVVAVNSVLDASGYVVARREATVSSKMTGKVAEILVEEGMRVEQGQIVARLDDTTQQAQLSLAKAQTAAAKSALAEVETQLRVARLERDRSRDLAAKKLASTSSVDAAEAAYDQTVARVATGRENVRVAERNTALSADALDNMTIRAPFAGMVVSKNAQPGEMISPVSAGGGFTRTGICTIVDTDSLEIEVDVNEAYIQRVKPDQPVAATLDAYPDWHIPAKVIAIVPTADREKATVRVRIGFLQRDDRVLRDMGVKVAFLGANTDAAEPPPDGVIVPTTALQSDATGDYVWQLNGKSVARQNVSVRHLPNASQILVTKGLSAGDTIVASSASPLHDGQAVKTEGK